MKKLSKANCDILDARYVTYDPEQLIEGQESWIPVVCPVHGPYMVQVKYLAQRHAKRNLRAIRCPGCKHEKVTDRERLEEIQRQFYVKEDPDLAIIPMYAPTENWEVMEHWEMPRLT